MIRPWVATAVVMLAACSAEPGNDGASTVRDEGPNTVESPSNASEGSPAGAGNGLHASVGDLTGTISGLNTRATDMGLVIDLPADALFDFDRSSLTAEAEAQLRKAADIIRRSPPGSLRIVGHTDDHGDEGYNQRLSIARAETVANWFKQQVGIRTRAFDVSGKGELEPVAPNARPDGSDDPAGRAKNRRVEVVIPRQTGR